MVWVIGGEAARFRGHGHYMTCELAGRMRITRQSSRTSHRSQKRPAVAMAAGINVANATVTDVQRTLRDHNIKYGKL